MKTLMTREQSKPGIKKLVEATSMKSMETKQLQNQRLVCWKPKKAHLGVTMSSGPPANAALHDDWKQSNKFMALVYPKPLQLSD